MEALRLKEAYLVIINILQNHKAEFEVKFDKFGHPVGIVVKTTGHSEGHSSVVGNTKSKK